jgi:hypothetical protein
MPGDSRAWGQELHLSNFVNAYYQLRDLRHCHGCRSILVVGPGQGLDTRVFRWRGFAVATLDIDGDFGPDYLGSVHDMHMFGPGQFDVVIASHVMEHLAVPYLDRALGEIARVGRYALIYLPVAGRRLQLRLKADVHGTDVSLTVDVHNPFHRPDGVTPRYCQGNHFWEAGMRGFRAGDLRRRMERCFTVLAEYRNPDWNSSHNFVLRSKQPVPC